MGLIADQLMKRSDDELLAQPVSMPARTADLAEIERAASDVIDSLNAEFDDARASKSRLRRWWRGEQGAAELMHYYIDSGDGPGTFFVSYGKPPAALMGSAPVPAFGDAVWLATVNPARGDDGSCAVTIALSGWMTGPHVAKSSSRDRYTEFVARLEHAVS